MFIALMLLSIISAGHVSADDDDETSVRINYLKILSLGGGDDIENDLLVKGKVSVGDDDDEIYVTLHVAGLNSDDHWSQTKEYYGDDQVKFTFLWYKIPAGDYAAWIVAEYEEGTIRSETIYFDPPGGGPGPPQY